MKVWIHQHGDELMVVASAEAAQAKVSAALAQWA
jgi:hypothetical protein